METYERQAWKGRLGQIMEAPEHLTEVNMFLFSLQTDNGEPLRTTGLERDSVRIDWRVWLEDYCSSAVVT